MYFSFKNYLNNCVQKFASDLCSILVDEFDSIFNHLVCFLSVIFRDNK
jgi:hypothetical protein